MPSGPSDRVMSVDVLRGFDMFWIVGGHGLLMSAIRLRGKPVPEWVSTQFEHARWGGFPAWDLIMPLFLFIVGAAMPFAFARYRSRQHSNRVFCFRILRRVSVLFVFGMIVQGNLLVFKLDQLYFFNNTLQAIAAGYLIASLALLALPVLGQLLLTVGLLVIYWLLMVFVSFGDHPAGTLEEKANLARHIDQWVFGSHVDGTRYTWVLSSLGFGATVLMGVLGGHILRSDKSPARRVLWLWGAGLGCLLAGWLWSFQFPIIKPIWTSSMALWSGGWSFLLLGLFYLIIDVWGFRRWAFPFVVIGMNAITAYMIWNVVNFGPLSQRLLGGIAKHLSQNAGSFLLTLGPVVILWLILLHMYRIRAFLKV
jgi:predicted acyltransferase